MTSPGFSRPSLPGGWFSPHGAPDPYEEYYTLGQDRWPLEQRIPGIRYETVQVDTNAEYYRLTQARNLEYRQENTTKFKDLLEQGRSALEAWHLIHG